MEKPRLAHRDREPADSSEGRIDAERTVLDIIERHLPGAQAEGMSVQSRLQADLGLPSINLVLILFDLQEAFGVNLVCQDPRLAELRTVSDLVAFVQRATSSGTSGEGPGSDANQDD
ncbi:MAG: acyl carrier protein [Isosphaeraceae bacterium]